jgi:flagellar motor switch protein FliN/FliY
MAGENDFTELTGPILQPSDAPARAARDLEAVYDIPVTVSAVLGRTTMQVSQLLKLGRGAVVELDRKLGEAIDVYVNNRLVARGEVVMVDDNRLGITMTEIVKADRAGNRANCPGGKERKNFFFEKKKQKTFAHCVQQAVQIGQLDATRNR